MSIRNAYTLLCILYLAAAIVSGGEIRYNTIVKVYLHCFFIQKRIKR